MTVTSHKHENNIRKVVCQQQSNAGITVAIIPDPSSELFSISLGVAVGMRDEKPGQDGIFHLLEHMVYRDSRGKTAQERELEVQYSGGILGGNTHMDYTEFYESGVSALLEQSIYRLVEQVFFPAFKTPQIEEQIRAVALERNNRLQNAPGEVLPWPHLTGMYWESFAESHDGTGTLELAQHVSVNDLQEVHRTFYIPESSVLTVMTSQEPHNILEQVLDIVDSFDFTHFSHPQEKHVGEIEIKYNPVTRTINSQDFVGKRVLSAGASSTCATCNDEHLGELLLAEVLSLQPALDASAGVFGIGDMTAYDLFVLVDDSGAVIDPRAHVRAAQYVSSEVLTRAFYRAMYKVERSIRDNQQLVRSTARDFLLRNNPGFMGDILGALKNLIDDDVRLRELLLDAVSRIANQSFAVLTVEGGKKI